ncbi:TIGR01906 family membrane protein [Candidatus Woesearchaeota archaeon]|nr:TIGR01906 family membrane protein [Candidatus Woesearchaeota archaeon]
MKPFAYILLIFILPIFILLLSLNLHVYNEKFYLKEFEKNNVYDNIEKESVLENYKLLIGYFKNKNDLENSFFNEKEKLHMIDVKRLVNLSGKILYISLILLVLLISYAIYKKDFDDLRSGLAIGNAITIMIIVLLILFVMFDFGSVFLNFHLGLFSNDLWQLNPATDKLIQMFPEEFFFDAFINILINSFIAIITVFSLLYILRIRTQVKK